MITIMHDIVDMLKVCLGSSCKIIDRGGGVRDEVVEKENLVIYLLFK
jgi:hypothetical protein